MLGKNIFMKLRNINISELSPLKTSYNQQLNNFKAFSIAFFSIIVVNTNLLTANVAYHMETSQWI